VQVTTADALWHGSFKHAPASSCWSAALARPSPMTWLVHPRPPRPPPCRSSNGTPGGGRSSRPTPPESRSSASGTPATGSRRPWSAPSRSGFLIQSLLIIWYTRSGYDRADITRRRLLCPWYHTKHEPAAADMLAKLRREFLKARFSAIRPGHTTHDQIATTLDLRHTAA